MALNSHMVPIGTPMPGAVLPDLEGTEVSLDDVAGGHPLLVAWVCNHCPYVRHVEDQLAAIHDEFGDKVQFVGIVSNDVDNYPADGPAGMREQIQRTGWSFPYLIDADQAVAKEFNAACTPDFFLYDRAGRLAYRGAMDASSPRNDQLHDGSLLREALAQVIAGEPVGEPHRPSTGCGIKWKPGNEPPAVTFV